MTLPTVRRVALVNVAAVAAGWVVYAVAVAANPPWLRWGAFVLGVVYVGTVLPLVAYGRRVAGGGRVTTAGLYAGMGVGIATAVLAAAHGVSVAHGNEVALLVDFLVLPWFVSFGLRLRDRRAGRAAIAFAAATTLIVAVRPFTSSAVPVGLLALAGGAAYAVWALALPGTQPATGAARRPRSRRWIVAQSAWLALVLLVFVPPVASGRTHDAVQLLADAGIVWVLGVWSLIGLELLFGRTPADAPRAV